jgi:hypothetical protein
MKGRGGTIKLSNFPAQIKNLPMQMGRFKQLTVVPATRMTACSHILSANASTGSRSAKEDFLVN